MPETRMVARLKDVSGVTDLIGAGDAARVWPILAPQGIDAADGAYMTYQRVGTEPCNHSTGECDVAWARIQVDCWADTYAGAKALAAAVKAALSGWSDATGTPVVSMCHWEGEYDDPGAAIPGEEIQEHRVIAEYRIEYET